MVVSRLPKCPKTKLQPSSSIPRTAHPVLGEPRTRQSAQSFEVSGCSPTDPTLRANPFPEVTDLVCRLPLPTLLYRPEAVNLGDRLRIWVRAGAKSPSPTPKFSRSHRPLVDPARTAGLFAKNQNPFSLREDSRGSAAYAEKTTLPRVRVDVSGSFHVAMLIRGSNSSATRLRNKDLIPFRPKLRS